MLTKRRSLVLLFLSFTISWLGVRWWNSRTRPSHQLGAVNGQLNLCGERPNCARTVDHPSGEELPPLTVAHSAEVDLGRIRSIILSMPGASLVSADDDYLHAKFRSRFWGFVDDLEVAVDGTGQKLHIRSSSRVGYSDLGVNRKRVQEIQRRFLARGE